MTMTDLEYHAALNTITAAARLILTTDIDTCRDVISKSEAIAPILEPTAYMRGGAERLQEQRQLRRSRTIPRHS